MAKKKTLKKSAGQDKKQANLAETLVGSANEIWLAGLGAFAKAQSEGKKIYDKLIDEGKDFEKLFKAVPQKAVKDVKTTVSATVSTAKKRASESWDKLEDVFEKRVEKSLHSLGVPTNKELQGLMDRIDSLTKEVSELAKSSGKKSSAKKAVKSAAKKATKKAGEAKKTATKAAKKVAKKATGSAKAAVKKVTKKAATKKTTTKKATKKVAKKVAKKVSKK